MVVFFSGGSTELPPAILFHVKNNLIKGIFGLLLVLTIGSVAFCFNIRRARDYFIILQIKYIYNRRIGPFCCPRVVGFS
uniref:Uncharacterized protein n=1 Tax=Triticum urartu TaxID=4572 RepID=A0A8R7UJX6_TRIUA